MCPQNTILQPVWHIFAFKHTFKHGMYKCRNCKILVNDTFVIPLLTMHGPINVKKKTFVNNVVHCLKKLKKVIMI
jgi:hypothetical protein